MNMECIASEWLNYKKNFVKISTFGYYENVIQTYIIPVFGQLEAENISESMIQDLIIKWRDDDRIKISTIKNIIMILKQCLHYANKTHKIPVKDFELHYGRTDASKRKKTFEVEDCIHIINAAKDNPTTRNLGVIISITCGIRIGELCALQWKDINRQRRTLRISKTLQRIYLADETPHTRIVISLPKTPTSIREIPLPDIAANMIHEIEVPDENYYVLSNTSKYIEPRTYRKYFHRFLLENGIEELNFHCLRHTFATACIEQGADIKCISDILGHSTINTTMNMYVHPSMEDKRKCMNLLNF